MANIERKEKNALAMRLQQANEIKQAVACFIPENAENQEIFSKNCLFYLIKNKAQMVDGNILINYKEKEVDGKKVTEGVKIDMFEFLQKMYLVSKSGLSLVDGEFTPVVYDGGEVVIIPDYRAEKRVAESKGLVITFLHGRNGDVFTREANPLKHTFTIKERAGEFKSIKKVNKISKKGKEYTVTESESDIIWYACVAEVIETKEVFSYVESTENILLRANPKTLDFYRNPNSQENMFEKFVLRQLAKRLPSNLRCVDFDKWEGKFEQVEEAQIVEETPAPAPAPRPIEQEKLPLVKDSETWTKMEKAIKSGMVKDITAIERKYIIAESDRPEILKMLMENCEPAESEKSPMNLFNE